MDALALRSGAFVPAQRLLAERAAQAAQRRADNLSAESQQARGEARRLNAQADRLEQQAVQSRRDADGARRQGDRAEPTTRVGATPEADNPLPSAQVRDDAARPALPYRAERLYRSLAEDRLSDRVATRLDLQA